MSLWAVHTVILKPTNENVKTVLEQQLSEAQSMTMPDLLSRRFDRIMLTVNLPIISLTAEKASMMSLLAFFVFYF